MRTSLLLNKISASIKRKVRTSYYAWFAHRFTSHVELSGSTGVEPYLHTVRGLLMSGGYVLTDGAGKVGQTLVDATFCMPINYATGIRRLQFLPIREYLGSKYAFPRLKASKDQGDYFLPPHVWIDNYYHFLVEGLPAIQWALSHTDLTIVLPVLKPSYARLMEHFGWDGQQRVKILQRGEPLFGYFSGLTNIRVVRKGTYTLPNPSLMDFYRMHAMSANQVGGVLVVSRRLTGDRRILNEDELVERLSVHSPCEVLVPERDDFDTQLHKIRMAAVIVGSHGAGLTNLLFNPGLKGVVEVSYGRAVNNSYLSLCESLGIGHRFFVTQKKGPRLLSGLDMFLPANRRSFILTQADMTGIIEAVKAHLPV